MNLLDGIRRLSAGDLTNASWAFAQATLAQEEGGKTVPSTAGRALSPTPSEVLNLDGGLHAVT